MTAKFATTIQAGDGSKTAFPVSFPFIVREDVDVYRLASTQNDLEQGAKLDVVETGVPTANQFKWDSDTQITVGLAPAVGERIKIQRTTDFTQQTVNWKDGSYVIADDLNTSEEQNLYVDQELYDYITDITDRFEDLFPDFISEKTVTAGAVDQGFSYDDWDDKRLATARAIKKLANVYSGSEPPQKIYPGKLWFEPGSTEYLRIWTGSNWRVITTNSGSITPFEPAEIIYVNTQGNDANNGRSKETAVRSIEQALKIANAKTNNPARTVTNATYDNVGGLVTITVDGDHGLTQGNSVSLTSLEWTCAGLGTKKYPSSTTTYPVAQTQGKKSFLIYVGPSGIVHEYVAGSGGTADPVDTVFGDGKIISVAAGVYAENMPLQVEAKNLSIIGDSLRNTYVHPKVPNDNTYDPNNPSTTSNELKIMFELDSGSYVTGFTFAGIKAKGSPGGYALDPDKTRGLPEYQGWVASFRKDAVITKSPYMQNCTNFADSSIDNRELGNYTNGSGFNPDYLGGEGGDVTSSPTGGGILCDGDRPAKNSPLRSFVVDAFTQIALDGPGILCTNLAYSQLVSFFGTFCKYHAKVRNGGQLNLSNCTTDFGEYGLIAEGKSGQIFTARCQTKVTKGDKGDQQEIVKIKNATFDAAKGELEIEPNGLTTAVNVGALVKIQFLVFQKDGNPDKFIPESFSKEFGIQSVDNVKGTFKIIIGNEEIDPADGWSYLADSGDLLVPTGGVNGPSPSTIITVDTLGGASPLWQPPRALVPGTTMLMEAGGVLYPIVNATGNAKKTEYVIQVYSPLNNFNKSNLGFVEDVAAGATVKFFLQSYISTGGHTMEFVGSGTDYRAHPDYGGVPVVTNQAVELGGDESGVADQLAPFNGGRVWLSSTDQDGNFNVGDTFQVNQKTGQIYIDPSVIVQPPLKIQENLDMGPWSIYTTYGTDTNLNLAPKGDGGLVIGGAVKTDGSAPVGPSTAPIIAPVKERSVVDTAGNTKDFPVVTQEDLGYDADEIPVSGLLGKLAFTDTPSVVGVSDSSPLPNELKFSVSGNTLTIKYQPPGGGAIKKTTLNLS